MSDSPFAVFGEQELLDLDPTSTLLVRTVLRHGPISRATAAGMIGLSSGSLTRLSRPLVDGGILQEGDPHAGPMGRPSLPLEIVDDAATFVGIKVTSGNLYGAVIGLKGHPRTQSSLKADTSTPELTVKAIKALLEKLIVGRCALAVGVSLSGVVDNNGSVITSKLLPWNDGHIGALVAEATGVPCVVSNCVDALTLGQHWLGHGRGMSDFAVVTLGGEVESGAVVGDHLLVGHTGAAALLGAAWTRDGRRFDAVIGGPAMVEAASHAAGSPLTFAQALRSSSPEVKAVLDEAARVVGEFAGLATLAYAPQRILIAGEYVGLLGTRRRIDLVRESMASVLPQATEAPEIVVEDFPLFEWARGAAVLGLQFALSG